MRRQGTASAQHPRARCGSIGQPYLGVPIYLAVLLSSELALLLAGVRGCMLEGRLRSRHARSRLERLAAMSAEILARQYSL